MPEQFIDISALSLEEFKALAYMKEDERSKALKNHLKEKYDQNDLRKVAKLSLWEDFCASLAFFFGVPGSVWTVPLFFYLIARFTGTQNIYSKRATHQKILLNVQVRPKQSPRWLY